MLKLIPRDGVEDDESCRMATRERRRGVSWEACLGRNGAAWEGFSPGFRAFIPATNQQVLLVVHGAPAWVLAGR